jgi:hypothetical protein
LEHKLEKLNVWVTKEQKDFLVIKSNIDGTSVSEITRSAITLYQDIEALQTSINEVAQIIDKQVDISIKKNMDRVVKLIIKAILSSESANHNSAEILSHIKKLDISEVKDTAYHYATNYLSKGGGTS